MFRRQLKAQARGLISTSKPSPILVAVAYAFAATLLSFLLLQIITLYVPYDQLVEQLQRSATSTQPLDAETIANMEKLAENCLDYLSSPFAVLLSLALVFVSYMLQAGFSLFALNTTNHTADFTDLFGGFSFVLRLVGYYIMRSIFVLLWTLLFIIPGIVAAYRYRMSFYLLVEHPEYSIFDCFRESSRMMRGHKMELLIMDFSFFGWQFLISALSVLGIVIKIWYLPYYEITNALFYRYLHERTYGTSDPVIDIG